MRVCLWLCAICLVGLFASPGGAQVGPDLAELVAQWAGGSLRAPVRCEIDGVMRQGVRRVLVEPLRTPGRSVNLELRFIDLRPGGASRCVDSKGHSLPNMIGRVELRWPGRSRPETAMRDFRETLKRKKGFEFVIVEGRIKVESVGPQGSPDRILDFRGGRCQISPLFPATDEARELAPFKSQRKFVITMKTRDGESITLPVFDPAAP